MGKILTAPQKGSARPPLGGSMSQKQPYSGHPEPWHGYIQKQCSRAGLPGYQHGRHLIVLGHHFGVPYAKCSLILATQTPGTATLKNGVAVPASRASKIAIISLSCGTILGCHALLWHQPGPASLETVLADKVYSLFKETHLREPAPSTCASGRGRWGK